MVEPGRGGDLHADGAEQIARTLLEDEADPPGGQQRIQRPGGEAVDDRPFNEAANDASTHERHRHGHQNAERAGDDLQGHISQIAAQHEHFAMRHVDDAHEAETEGEAQGREDEEGCDGEAIEDLAEEECGFMHERDPKKEALLF